MFLPDLLNPLHLLQTEHTSARQSKPMPHIYTQRKWKWSHSVVSDFSRPLGLQPTRLLHPWDFPGKSTGVGCHFLLQGIFPTQRLNPGLPHCRQMLYYNSKASAWRPFSVPPRPYFPQLSEPPHMDTKLLLFLHSSTPYLPARAHTNLS